MAGREPGGYHLEYGYSCMGYEIAGGLGAKLALPDREVIVMVGDGSYLMMNSEIATSVMLGPKLDHRRARQSRLRLHQPAAAVLRRRALQQSSQGHGHVTLPAIDFAAHAAASGALAEKVASIAELEAALDKARASGSHPCDRHRHRPGYRTAEGGAWWDVPVPEVVVARQVKQARKAYEQALAGREQK